MDERKRKVALLDAVERCKYVDTLERLVDGVDDAALVPALIVCATRPADISAAFADVLTSRIQDVDAAMLNIINMFDAATLPIMGIVNALANKATPVGIGQALAVAVDKNVDVSHLASKPFDASAAAITAARFCSAATVKRFVTKKDGAAVVALSIVRFGEEQDRHKFLADAGITDCDPTEIVEYAFTALSSDVLCAVVKQVVAMTRNVHFEDRDKLKKAMSDLKKTRADLEKTRADLINTTELHQGTIDGFKKTIDELEKTRAELEQTRADLADVKRARKRMKETKA